jgi:hypothetical protein
MARAGHYGGRQRHHGNLLSELPATGGHYSSGARITAPDERTGSDRARHRLTVFLTSYMDRRVVLEGNTALS